jgi:hypothetical protein
LWRVFQLCVAIGETAAKSLQEIHATHETEASTTGRMIAMGCGFSARHQQSPRNLHCFTKHPRGRPVTRSGDKDGMEEANVDRA